MSCIGKKEPVAVTKTVTLICLLSTRRLMGTFLTPSMKKCTFPERHTKELSDLD